jgi:protein-disulfide isomerase
VTVVYHPIAILDRYSTTEYSTRSAAASAAAAEGGKFLAFHDALYAQQPPEGGPGLDDAKLIEIGRSVGLTDPAFADAVTKGTYRGWATTVTDTASARGVTGTPTVLVGGKKLDRPTPEALSAAVTAAAGAG